MVEIKRSPPEDKRVRRDKDRLKRDAAVTKERWTVKNLYPYCNVSMDIVAVNTFYESNGSNVLSIVTPEGGRVRENFLAYQIRKSEVFTWDRHAFLACQTRFFTIFISGDKSYLTYPYPIPYR